MTWLEFFKKLIQALGPAIGVILYEYEESKVNQANSEKEKALTDLQILKNHEVVDENLAGKSDADIVLDAAGEGPSGQSQNNTPPINVNPGTSSAGDIAGQTVKPS